MSARNPLGTYLQASDRPVTLILIALMILGFLVTWFASGFLSVLAFFPSSTHPWTFLTYPFSSSGNGAGLVFFLLLLYWFYWVGGDVERELDAKRYLLLFFELTLVASLSFWLAQRVLGSSTPLIGADLPIAAFTVYWATRNPRRIIMICGLIPLSGKLIGFFDVLLVFFGYGTPYPPLGVVALIPLALAFGHASGRIPLLGLPASSRRPSKVAKANERRNQAYYDDVQRRSKEREERERLRKLFEGSLKDDDEA